MFKKIKALFLRKKTTIKTEHGEKPFLTGKIVVNRSEESKRIGYLHREATRRKNEGDLEGAIKCLQEAQKLIRKNIGSYPRGTYARLAQFLRKAGRIEEAEAELKAVTELAELATQKRYAKQLERARRNKKSHPWLLLRHGPTVEPCPIHAKNDGLVLPVDDSYWTDYPMRSIPECRCGVRCIRKREYERLKEKGKIKEAPVL